MRVAFYTSHELGLEAFRYARTFNNFELAILSSDAEKFDYPNVSYDLGVSFLYHHKVPATELAKTTWVNFHPAPLPQYRGRNVAYHAIKNKESVFGATLHLIDENFDTGNIIEVRTFPIEDNMNAGDVASRAQQMCYELFQDHLPQLLRGKRIDAKRQGEGTYYKKTEINPFVELTEEQQMEIRAITAFPNFLAKTMIGGVDYVIAPAGELYHPDDESPKTVRAMFDKLVRDYQRD